MDPVKPGDWSESAPPFKVVKLDIIPSTWDRHCIRCHGKLDIWGVYCEDCYNRIREAH